jgi:integrase
MLALPWQFMVKGQQMSLSDLAIRRAKPDTNRTIKLSDGGGLQLWITPRGSKLWRIAYRFDGKQKKLALGPYPVVTLAEAREQLEIAKRLLIRNIDPSTNRKDERRIAVERQADTFELIARELLEKKTNEGKAPKTMQKLEWLLSLVLPDIGHLPITEIDAPEVLAALRVVEARGRLETAHRLRGVIGEVFRYAVATARASGDPTAALRGALVIPKVTHRPAITDEAELGGLLRAIAGYAGAPEVRIALQLLALTFVRPGELRKATWTEVDMDKAIWSIPAERMKMGRPHRVPLAKPTLQLLSKLRRLSGHLELLFPGARSSARPMSDNTLNAALRRIGYSKDEMTAHGFRATASTILNESGLWNPDAIEAQLAHVENNAIRRAYARAQYWDERVRMMDWWAQKIETLGVAEAHSLQ